MNLNHTKQRKNFELILKVLKKIREENLKALECYIIGSRADFFSTSYRQSSDIDLLVISNMKNVVKRTILPKIQNTNVQIHYLNKNEIEEPTLHTKGILVYLDSIKKNLLPPKYQWQENYDPLYEILSFFNIYNRYLYLKKLLNLQGNQVFDLNDIKKIEEYLKGKVEKNLKFPNSIELLRRFDFIIPYNKSLFKEIETILDYIHLSLVEIYERKIKTLNTELNNSLIELIQHEESAILKS